MSIELNLNYLVICMTYASFSYMYDAVLLRPLNNGVPSMVRAEFVFCSLFLEKPSREGFPVEDGYSPFDATKSIKQEARLRVLSSFR